MRTSEEKASSYRGRLAECERLAANATNAENREILKNIGLRWQAFADLERHHFRGLPPPIRLNKVKTAAELVAETQHLREVARSVLDPEALRAVRDLIAELERRAQELENGDE